MPGVRNWELVIVIALAVSYRTIVQALDGGSDGLVPITSVVASSPSWLRRGGWLALEVVDEHTVGIRIQPKDIRYELIGLMMSPNFAPEVVSFGPAVSRPVHLSINKVVNRRGTSPHLTNESLYTLSREQLDQLVELGSLRVGRIIFQLLEASRD